MKGVRTYELASAYFPARRRESSVRRLRRWIAADRHLRQALERAGYHKGQRWYTARQADVFRRIMGAACQ